MGKYWNGVLLGVLVGSIVTLFYKNNQQEIKQSARQVKARYKRYSNMFNDLKQETDDTLEK
ncbi:MAG: YtxH domain-containing protein [Syntrophomonadaceae bacterium]|jgi:hypothetical protein